LMPHRNNQSQIESGVPAETDGIVEDWNLPSYYNVQIYHVQNTDILPELLAYKFCFAHISLEYKTHFKI
jgi:hypothetical protein